MEANTVLMYFNISGYCLLRKKVNQKALLANQNSPPAGFPHRDIQNWQLKRGGGVPSLPVVLNSYSLICKPSI